MKKMLWGLAASALVLSSCSTNEVDDVISGNDNPNVINFMSSTTKAGVNTITDIEKGFNVYASNGTNPKWYLGPQTYLKNTVWEWAEGSSVTTWPAAGTENYPLNFFAYNTPSSMGGGFTLNAETPGALTAAITVGIPESTNGAVTTNQFDFLAAKNSASTKPANGYLTLTFKHIMSKINAAIIPGNGVTAKVQALKFQQPRTNGTFNYVAQTWSDPTSVTKAPMTYWNSGTNKTVKDFAGTDPSEAAKQPFYTPATTHSNNLMLVPQGLTAWAIGETKPDAPEGDESYIEVIYRVINSAAPNADLVGWTKAEDAPGYDKDNEAHAKYAGKPLFIKVGFPLAATWEMGKGYTYNIKLGTADATGGNYLDDTYYDENGVDTNIPIKDGGGKPVKPGDPVANGTINFTVDVTGWDDQADTEIK